MSPELQAQLTRLRHDLHKIPEVSGAEEKTAAVIAGFLRSHAPDALLTGLGGHGVVAVYEGAEDGPAVLIRCELDGLPITEISGLPYRSAHPGRGHLCGHDGHMAMVAGLAVQLAEQRPAKGRVVLLFQPSEETGKGAAAVIADPRFQQVAPDYAFALHNLPGLAVALCTGPANCASRGLRITLTGKTSHAAAPQDGISPAPAIARLLTALPALGPGGGLDEGFALVTVTHAQLGEAAFGIAPGAGEVWATLRTVTDARMAELSAAAEALAQQAASEAGLQISIAYDDVFEACSNHPDATEILKTACETAGYPAKLRREPQRWSEDFGQFGKQAKAAMFWLGSGTEQPQLHNPDYDFPDAAIPAGLAVFREAVNAILGGAAARNS